MLSISVKHNIPEVIAKRQHLHKSQIPYAINNAINQTALSVKAAEKEAIRTGFDRPTPWAINSVYMRAANKRTLTATVWLKSYPGQPHFLEPQIHGGDRPAKRFEKMLRDALRVPSSFLAVPGAAAKLDAYGNIQRGQIVQILAYFRAFRDAGFSANMGDKDRRRLAKTTKKRQGFRYFVGSPGGGRLPLGVWQRFEFAHGTAIKPVLIFVDRATYRKRYDFFGIAQRIVAREFGMHLKASVAAVLKANQK